MANVTICDKSLWSEFKLPASASASVTSDKLILTEGKLGDDGVNNYAGDLVVIIPALTAVIVPDGKTVTVTVEYSDDDFTNVKETVTLATLTGSTGVAKTVIRYRIPNKFPGNALRVKVAFGADTTDGSAVKAMAIWEV